MMMQWWWNMTLAMMSGHVVRGSRLLPTYCIGKDILWTVNLSVYPSVCLPCLVCPHFFSFHLSVSLCLYPSVCVSLSVWLFICLSVCRSGSLFVSLRICRCLSAFFFLPADFYVRLSVYLSPRVFVCHALCLTIWYRNVEAMKLFVLVGGRHG